MTDTALVHVAVGMIRHPTDRTVLLASRPGGKVYAGWWEFSGGKLEPGEAVGQALARELQEELGLSVISAQPGWQISHRYEHAHVQLHFWWVEEWTGNPSPREGQQLCWVRPEGPYPHPLLPATIPALERLRAEAEQARAHTTAFFP